MTISKDKQKIPEVSAIEALDVLKSDSRSVLLDVRSKMEFDYVGHPTGAVNVAWQEPPSWEEVPNFVARVRSALSTIKPQDPPEALTLFTLCRSGKRSYDAGLELARHGFTNVINIAEGFEGGLDANKQRGQLGGWRFHKLPWEQT